MNVQFFSVFGNDIYDSVGIDTGNGSDGSVYPALFGIVLDENNLCAGFYSQFHKCRKTAFGELAMYFSLQGDGFAGKFGKAAFVDVVYVVSAGGKSDVHVVFACLYRGVVTCVQQLEVGCSGGVCADMVEYVDEDFVGLSVYFSQLDGYQLHFAEYTCREEVGIGVEAINNFSFIAFHYRFQLEGISYEQQLFSAKGLTHVL